MNNLGKTLISLLIITMLGCSTTRKLDYHGLPGDLKAGNEAIVQMRDGKRYDVKIAAITKTHIHVFHNASRNFSEEAIPINVISHIEIEETDVTSTSVVVGVSIALIAVGYAALKVIGIP